MLTNCQKGVFFALITAVISGVSIFLNKYSVGFITPPLLFTGLKNATVALILFSLIILSRKLPLLKALTKREVTFLLLIGLVGGTLPFYLFFTGLTTVSAINASLIQKLLVFWVAVLALPILRERVTRVQLIAVFLLFTANFFVGGFKGFAFSKGELMIFGSTFFWAVEYVLASKVLKTVHPDLVAAFRMGIGSTILLTASLISPTRLIFSLTTPGFFWVCLTILLLLTYVITLYRALKYAPAVLVTSTLVSATLVTNLLSAIFITKSVSSLFIIQTVIITFGVGIIVLTSREVLTDSVSRTQEF